MKQIELQKKSAGYSVATVGNPSSFEGKAFIKELMGTTSMEISFGSLESGQAVPFFHSHKQNEEVYIVLSGKDTFILDGEEVAVEAGSIVRIAPSVSRCNKNTGMEPFVYVCIQAKDNSLEQSVAEDAEIQQ